MKYRADHSPTCRFVGSDAYLKAQKVVLDPNCQRCSFRIQYGYWPNSMRKNAMAQMEPRPERARTDPEAEKAVR